MPTTTKQPVRFGLSLSNRAVLFGLSPELLLEMARLADESEVFDSVWVGDNLLSKPRLEAIATLSALAVRTRRVRLGAICLGSFPLRHPLILAIQWASLDVLAGGRTILGVCAGASADQGPQFAAELEAMRVPTQERIPRLEEGIDLLRRFWAAEPVSFRGRFYEFDTVNALPKPVQERVPIYLGVNPRKELGPAVTERALRRVARLADGWQVDGTPSEVFAEHWRRIKGYAAEYGRAAEVKDACFHMMVNINEDAAAARSESVEFLARYYGAGRVSSEKLEAWLAAGPPSAVIDKISRFIEAGCTIPVLRFTALNPLAQLERCLADVLPAFRGMLAQDRTSAGAGTA